MIKPEVTKGCCVPKGWGEEIIIENKEFVRNFDSMYQNIEDPWNQKQNNEKCLMNQAAFFF